MSLVETALFFGCRKAGLLCVMQFEGGFHPPPPVNAMGLWQTKTPQRRNPLFQGILLMSPFGVCPPYKGLFFSTSCFLCPKTLGGESANFGVQFGMANEDANLLNVLAEAKNGEFCQYNLVYLEKMSLLVGPTLCDQLLKRMLVSSGSRYDMPDHKM